jgi:hypothetical protein
VLLSGIGDYPESLFPQNNREIYRGFLRRSPGSSNSARNMQFHEASRELTGKYQEIEKRPQVNVNLRVNTISKKIQDINRELTGKFTFSTAGT